MRTRHWVGIAVIIAFFAYAAVSFSSSLTPYVTFSQAKSASGSVQVKGVLANSKVKTNDNGKSLEFTLRDDSGEEAVVVYRGARPDGLEQATSIVAIGKYTGEKFVADKLLVKCPSKYQGSVKKQ